jgi:hypothetical protein
MQSRRSRFSGAIDWTLSVQASRSRLSTLAVTQLVRSRRSVSRLPTPRHYAAVLGRVQVLRCAPPLRAPSATWTRPARGSRVAFIRRQPDDLEERQVGNIRRDLSSGDIRVWDVPNRPASCTQNYNAARAETPNAHANCSRHTSRQSIVPEMVQPDEQGVDMNAHEIVATVTRLLVAPGQTESPGSA